jgi:molybdate transport system permease protein
MMDRARDEPPRGHREWPFFLALGLLGGVYVVLLLAMLIANAAYTTPEHILAALRSPEIQYAIRLSLISSLITAQLALWIAVPIGYLMSRCQFPGKAWLDALLDLPVVLPPLVLGLSLLILFQTPVGRAIERVVPLTAAVPGVVLAQSLVATALAVRTMRVVFDRIPIRTEQVAWTLGCTRAQGFFRVVLPQAYPGMVSAGTLAWARALGDFGPVLVFAGTMRMKTETLPTSIYIELSLGNLPAAVAISLVMVAAADLGWVIIRRFGLGGGV